MHTAAFFGDDDGRTERMEVGTDFAAARLDLPGCARFADEHLVDLKLHGFVGGIA